MYKQNLHGEYIFRQLNDGLYHCINRDYPDTPVDLCDEFNVAVPDCTQFLRCILDWCDTGFEFRNYGGEIRINIYARR